MNDSETKAEVKRTPGQYIVDSTKATGAYGVYTSKGPHWRDDVNEQCSALVCTVFQQRESDQPQAVRDANAAFIAHACNCHDELVYALEMLLISAIQLAPFSPDIAEAMVAIIGIAQEKLDKAKGGAK